jgi:hypothetical protein
MVSYDYFKIKAMNIYKCNGNQSLEYRARTNSRNVIYIIFLTSEKDDIQHNISTVSLPLSHIFRHSLMINTRKTIT